MINRNEFDFDRSRFIPRIEEANICIYIYIYVYSSSHFFFQLTNLSTSYHATKEGRTNESWIIPRMNRQPRHCSIPDKRSLFFFFFFFFCIIFILYDDLQVFPTWRGGPRRVYKISTCRIIFINELKNVFNIARF